MISKIYKCAAFTVLLSLCLYSQAQTRIGNLHHHIDSLIDSLPAAGGNDWVQPNAGQLAQWDSMLRLLVHNDIDSARFWADSLNYDIVMFYDTLVQERALYYLLREQQPQLYYWGMYVINPLARRSRLVLQAPHPRFDFRTGQQASFCFTRLSAKALFVSGTHRCNMADSTSCSGKTDVCGVYGSYKVSDMAHQDTSIFHLSTQVLERELDHPIFIQHHGFGKGQNDPYLIMSNGTRFTPGTDYLTVLRDELDAIDTTLSFKIAHIDTTWDRLNGTTNIQGRHINGSGNPCNNLPNGTTGRFLHIEQERFRLREDSTGWNKMFQALKVVFVEDSVYNYKFWLGRDTAWNQANNWHPAGVPTDTTHVILLSSPPAGQHARLNADAQCLNLFLHSAAELRTRNYTLRVHGNYFHKGSIWVETGGNVRVEP